MTLREHHAVLDTDASQFLIVSVDALEVAGRPAGSVLPFDVGSSELWLSVKTGAQFGPVDVTTRLHETEPEVGVEWEDVDEIGVSSAGPLDVRELDSGDMLPLTEQAGEYRIRISARGRDDGNAIPYHVLLDGEDRAAVEHYLIEAWPAPVAESAIVRLSSRVATREAGYAEPEPPRPHERAAVAAAQAIGRDLAGEDGARLLSRELGTVVVRAELVGTRRGYFRLLSEIYAWWGRIQGCDRCEVGGTFVLRQAPGRPGHAASALVGPDGNVRCTWLALEPPSSVSMTWEWISPPATDTPSSGDERHPLLQHPSSLRFDLTESKRPSDEPMSGIRVEHRALPIEWINDMETFWLDRLELAELVYSLNHR